MEVSNYYSLTTRCFTLRCSHPEWLISTQLFYNQILLFYYNLFLDLIEEGEENAVNYNEATGKDVKLQDKYRNLSALNSQQILRELEIRSITGRNRVPVPTPLPWFRVPLYFRRAAANAGIAAGRSYLKREEQKHRTECFHESVTYYKGTYKDFDQSQITLKVWTESEWRWLRCRLTGNTFSEQQQDILSPSVVIKTGAFYLHVPVRKKVESGGNAKKCMAEGLNICSVQFTNGDSFAVCAVLDRVSSLVVAKFLKGGRQYSHSCKRILEKLEKSKASTAGQEKIKANQRYWLKLQNISNYYSHQTSRQIVDLARLEKCGVIVFPTYDEQYKKIVMKTVGNWSPLHLSNRIRTQVTYKARQLGILVLEADAKNTGRICAICGAPVKKNNDEFNCPNGHKGNRYVNTCINLGRKCRDSFERNGRT